MEIIKKWDIFEIIRRLKIHHKMLIVLIIAYFIYLYYATALVENKQQICSIDMVNCTGKLMNFSGITECCMDALLYPPDKQVPKSNVTLEHILVGIGLVLITILLIIKEIYAPMDITWRDARKIAKQEVQYAIDTGDFDKGKITLGTTKLRYFLDDHRPYKWAIGASIQSEESGTKIWLQADIRPHWMSDKPEAHLITLKERRTELKSEDIDKLDLVDVHYIMDFELKMRKLYEKQMGRKSLIRS